MPYPVIPTEITVHLGLPDAQAQNVTVPWIDYIKNVASHEVYPTWPEESIRANVIAQISYALNRVYTEYYPSRGYDFDITSTTQYDQAYVYGDAVFDNISLLVDQIFNEYLVRGDSIVPLHAIFCDGVRTQCRGLSQWGSVDLAEQGYDAFSILQYYYGDNINLVTNAPIRGISPSYPGFPLSRGDALEEVRIIANELNRIGQNYPAIPRIDPVTVVFDENVEAAVRAFQQIFNLTVDGIVGKATWYRIRELWADVKQLSELLSEGLTVTEAARQYPRALGFGDTGAGVRTVQYYLAFLGFFLPELPPIGITGVFDENTRDAVYTFQSQNGLAIDGIVGRDTWIALQQAYNMLLSDLPEEYRQYSDQIYPGRFLVFGDTGESVRQLQTNLRTISLNDPAIPEITVTGTYDMATQEAVMALQRQLGLEQTGSVGPLLWVQIMNQGSVL